MLTVVILTSLPSKADSLVFLATGGHHHLLLVVLLVLLLVLVLLVVVHDQALLEVVQPLLRLVSCPAVWPAGGLTEPALRSALLAVFSDQRLQLLPGQLLVLGQDRPGLTDHHNINNSS